MSDTIGQPGSVAKIFIVLGTLLASLVFLLSSVCGGGLLVAGVMYPSDLGTSVGFFFVSALFAVPTYFAARAGWRSVNAWGRQASVVPPPPPPPESPAGDPPAHD